MRWAKIGQWVKGLLAATKWIAGVMLVVLALLGGLLATGVAGAIVDALR